MPRWKVAAVALAAVGGLLTVAVPAAPASPGVPVVRLDGRGHGHGVGLSQRGAEQLAHQGRTAWEILQTFYPGTEPGTAGGLVRVSVHRAEPASVTLAFPTGGEVRSGPSGEQAPGFPVQVGPGGQVRVRLDAGYLVEPLVIAASPTAATRYRSEPCMVPVLCPPTHEPPPAPTTTTTTTTAPPPPGGSGDDRSGGSDGSDGGGTAPPAPQQPAPGHDAPPPATGPTEAPAGPLRSSEPVWAVPSAGGATTVLERGRTYRGALEATAEGAALRVINQVDVETYLAGMAEVPGSWPAAAVEAQAIAARTYALRAMRASGVICDDERCQVYVGVDREHPGQVAAVEATRGQVVTYGGELAAAVYSADAGGISATTAEGFGTADGSYPYLTTVRYGPSEIHDSRWGAEVALRDVGQRLRYGGTVTDVRVAAVGPSGRALQVTLDGDAGPVEVDGRRFASALGLRSTLFSADVGLAGSAPEPLQPVELQALPEIPGATAAVATSLPAVDLAARAGVLMGRGDLVARMVPAPGDEAARRRAGRLAVLVLAAVTAWGAGALGPGSAADGPQPWPAPVRWVTAGALAPLGDRRRRRPPGMVAAATARRGASRLRRATLTAWSRRGR